MSVLALNPGIWYVSVLRITISILYFYIFIGILLKQYQDNEANKMVIQKRREKGQAKSGRRIVEDRRVLNEEPHDPDRRNRQVRRTQADKRKSTS